MKIIAIITLLFLPLQILANLNKLTKSDWLFLQKYCRDFLSNNKENIEIYTNESGFYRVKISSPANCKKDIITITKKGVDGNKIMFDKLKSNSFSWIKNQVFDKRPWGDYENILEKENFKIKIITVKPNSELSYQIHKQRSEHWIVISGIGIVILDDKQITLLENESIYIPQHSKHKIINKNNTQDLIFVEIQCGSYFGEDDIIRINDKYSRN
jgi:mannose-6-phosphate isomerase-like protein (cupin superfamily)